MEPHRQAFTRRAALSCSPVLRAMVEARLDALHHRLPRGHNLKINRPAEPHTANRARDWHHRQGHNIIVGTGDCRFDHRHIPQHMTDEWFHHHFADLEDISPLHLRRAAAIRLVQMSNGVSRVTAGELLGIPYGRVVPSASAVRVWTRDPARDAQLNTAINDFADQLNTTTSLIDYDNRRAALQEWELPEDHWLLLHQQLIRTCRRASLLQRADRSDRQRRAASVVVWATVTQGDHHLAPLVSTEHRRANGGKANMLLFDVQQARYGARRSPTGPTAALHALLDSYALELAHKIDSEPPRRVATLAN